MGHGVRHGLKIGKNRILHYSEFKDAPKKEFVAQLHCNEYGGESLVDIIATNKDKSFINDGFRSVYENLIYFIGLLQPSSKMLIILVTVILLEMVVIYWVSFIGLNRLINW